MWPQKNRQLAIRADDPGVSDPFKIHAQGLGEDGEEIDVDVSPSLARIEISGALVDEVSVFGRFFGGETPYQSIRAAVAAADASSANTTLVTIRSPGGDSIGMGETAAAIRSASNSVAVWMPKGFSAGYGIISGADVIAMPPEGLTGSLSTFTVSIDESAAAEKAGVKVRIHSPDKTKGAGFPGAPVPDAALKELDELAVKGKEQFADVIAAGRPDIEGLDALMKAQIFTADEALEAGLIDEIHDTEAAFVASLFTNTEEAPMADDKKEGAGSDAGNDSNRDTAPPGIDALVAASASNAESVKALLATVETVSADVKNLTSQVATLASGQQKTEDEKLRDRLEALGVSNVDLEAKCFVFYSPELREEKLTQLAADKKARDEFSRIDVSQLADLANTYDSEAADGSPIKVRRDGGLVGADPADVDQEDARLHALASAFAAKDHKEGSDEYDVAYESFCSEHERREVSA